jgi:hypothetical protein
MSFVIHERIARFGKSRKISDRVVGKAKFSQLSDERRQRHCAEKDIEKRC